MARENDLVHAASLANSAIAFKGFLRQGKECRDEHQQIIEKLKTGSPDRSSINRAGATRVIQFVG